MQTIAETPGNITFTTDSGEEATIKRLEIDEAERNLGVRLAPIGHFNTEYEFRKKQILEFCGKLKTTPFFHHQDMETIYTIRWKPIISYCLPIS